MKKRTNWSTNVITGTPQKSQTNSHDKFGGTGAGNGKGYPFGDGNRWGGKASADLPGKRQTVGGTLLIVFCVVIVIGIIISLVKNGPAMFAALKAGVQNLFEMLVSILVIALVLWILAMATIGRFLPAKLKPYSFLIVIGLIILCKVSPESAASIFIIIGMVIVLSRFFKH